MWSNGSLLFKKKKAVKKHSYFAKLSTNVLFNFWRKKYIFYFLLKYMSEPLISYFYMSKIIVSVLWLQCRLWILLPSLPTPVCFPSLFKRFWMKKIKQTEDELPREGGGEKKQPPSYSSATHLNFIGEAVGFNFPETVFALVDEWKIFDRGGESSRREWAVVLVAGGVFNSKALLSAGAHLISQAERPRGTAFTGPRPCFLCTFAAEATSCCASPRSDGELLQVSPHQSLEGTPLKLNRSRVLQVLFFILLFFFFFPSSPSFSRSTCDQFRPRPSADSGS